MKVMVKEAKNISTDVQYPELGEKDNGPSAQVVLPRELFTKYEGKNFFFSVEEIQVPSFISPLFQLTTFTIFVERTNLFVSVPLSFSVDLEK